MEVVGQVAVVAAEARPCEAGLLAVADRQGREVERRRPALALLDQLRGARLAERDARRTQEKLRLALAERECVRAELEQPPARAERRERERRRHPRRRDEHRPLGFVVDQGRDRLERFAGPEQVEVVEHEHDRAPGRQLRGKPGNRLRPERARGLVRRDRLPPPRPLRARRKFTARLRTRPPEAARSSPRGPPVIVKVCSGITPPTCSSDKFRSW